MKSLIAALALLPAISVAAFINGVGDDQWSPLTDCIVSWDYDTANNALISGFRIEVNGEKKLSVSKTLRQVHCSNLHLQNGLMTLRLYAYRGDDYSAPSNSIEFYFRISHVSQTYTEDPSILAPVLHLSTVPQEPI